MALGASWAILPRLASASADPASGLWLAGDLHCHTTYSHDVYGGPDDDNTGPEDFYTLGWSVAEQIAIAESRGLDYLAITDHNDVRALTDPGYHSVTGNLTLIPGYEHSMSGGHAGCLGVSNLIDVDTRTDAGALRLRDAVHDLGGTFILNHPFWDKQGKQSWEYSVEVRPDSIEVWNISWPFRADVAQGQTATSNNYKSLPLWEEYLSRWGRIPANGGSDNHWRSTTAAQGVGQPCTWVFAKDRAWGSILEAIKAGRTTVSALPPLMGGARVFLTAKSGSEEYMAGDTVLGSATIVVRVVGAPGHMLKLVADGTALEPVPVTSVDFEYRTTMRPASRVRAEVYLDEGYWMAALTSPLYFA